MNQAFSRLKAAGVQATGSKCALAQGEFLCLGHLVARQGILPDDSNVANIASCIASGIVKECDLSGGMANCYS